MAQPITRYPRGVLSPMRATMAGALLAVGLVLTPSAAQDDNTSRVVALFFREPNWDNFEACRQLILDGQPMEVIEAAAKYVTSDEFLSKDDRFRRSRILNLRWLLGDAGANAVVVRMVRASPQRGMDVWTMPHFKYAERWSLPGTYVPMAVYDHVRAHATTFRGSLTCYAYSAERPLSSARVATEWAMLSIVAQDASGAQKVKEAFAELGKGIRSLAEDPTKTLALAWAHATRGDLLAACTRWDEAEAAYSAALRLEPELLQVYRLRAAVRRETHDEEGAGEDDVRADELLVSAMLDWARGQITPGQVASAVGDHFAMTAFGGYTDSHNEGFCHWVVANASEEALALCEGVVAELPKGHDPFGQTPSKVRALLGPAGQHHVMVCALRAAVDAGTDNLCGTRYDAVCGYLKATEREPTPWAYIPVRLYADMARMEKGPHYQYCRLSTPRRLCVDAIAARARGETAQAQESFNQALKQCQVVATQGGADPAKGNQVAKAYAACGELHATWQKWEAAAAFYTKALETEPDFIWAYRMRAEAYRKLGKEEPASKDEAQAGRLLAAQVRDWAGQGKTIRLISNPLGQPGY